MANHKLDMGKAWTQATGLIGTNRDTIGAIAGLFFFLPALALALFAPELTNPAPAGPANADPQVAMQAMMDQVTQAYADNWPLFLAMTLAQFIGSLSLLALLTDRDRPTVREALTAGLACLPSYLGAQLLSAFGVALIIGLPLGLIAAAGSPMAAALAGIVLVLIGLYVFVKFTLISPVIAIDGERNPIKALARSWRLTKGNSFRIAAFLLLLFFTIGIIAALVSGILGLVLSALGSEIATIGIGVVNAAVNTGIGVIFLVVIAAIHRQLAGQSPEGIAATFE
jgi:hypothetical protein